jgi:hypothetical protein
MGTMTQWTEPRFIITLLLIGLFGFAYMQDASDQAMKGAIIAAFSAAYGFWIGSKQNEQATENTGKAFEAIREAARAGTGDGGTLRAGDTVQLDKPDAAGLAEQFKADKP